MSTRTILFGVVAVCVAAVCVRLGIWQLDRLSQRRAKNQLIVAQTERASVPVGQLVGQDTSVTHWRRVTMRGVADYSVEMVQSSRSQSGAPGVYLLTPVRPLDGVWGDTSVLVLRGYVYSANGRTIDFESAREPDTLSFDALVTEFPPPSTGPIRLPSEPRAVRAIDRDTLQSLMRRPLANFVLLALGDTVTRDVKKAARIPRPSLGEGSHQSYAYQWFAFATVAILGFVAVARSDRHRDRDAKRRLSH